MIPDSRAEYKPSVLIIDDNPENIDVLSNILRTEFRIMAVTSGEKALQTTLKKSQPDLILLDVKMPGIDGFETCQLLKSNNKTSHIPVIFITAEMDAESEKCGLGLGAVDYITKPFNPSLVKVRITNHLLLKQHRDNLEMLIKERTAELHYEHEKSLKSERLYRGLMEAAPDSVVLVNNQGVIELANETVNRMFGYKPDELCGCLVEELIPNRYIGNHKEFRREYFKDPYIRESFSINGLIAKRKDGTEFPADICLSPLTTDEGGMIICDIRDISEQTRMGEQLRQAQKMEAIGQLTGGIAHDFNNMLTSILGYTELALNQHEGKQDEKMNQYLNSVHQAGEQARELITQMMVFSRGNSRIKHQALDLTPVLDEIVRMLRPVLTSSIRIALDIDNGIPGVMADSVEISQIIMNLCINARDALQGRGLIKINLRNVVLPDDVCTSCHECFNGHFVEITVSDDGSGIDPETLINIFNPFFTTKEVGKGTGMGLSVVHGNVHNCGGHIIVNSTPDEGTKFRLFLPALEIKKTEGGLADVTNNIELSGEGLHTLVVDDEESIGILIEELLSSRGFHVHRFVDGISALDYFNHHGESIDLVITDQTMPNMTGAEMVQIMLQKRKDLPVILASGYSALINEESAKKIGVGAYLNKPFLHDELLNTVNNLMASQKRIKTSNTEF